MKTSIEILEHAKDYVGYDRTFRGDVIPYISPELLRAIEDGIAALRAQRETEKNEPLTLDELRGMDREPVYIVYGEWKDWRIPDFIDIGAYKGFIRFTDKSAELIAEYGKDWLAYRRKPEEGTV